MHRTQGGNLEKPASLDVIEIPKQANLAMNLVKHALFCFAILTVAGVDPAVAKPHFDTL